VRRDAIASGDRDRPIGVSAIAPRALRYLKAVMEAGSYASAAVQLGINSSNLTRQILSLEDKLGLTLLERSRSGVRSGGGDDRGQPAAIAVAIQ
jgi:molybdenum-dependent DNA-binding transcriptional regulator ModE